MTDNLHTIQDPVLREALHKLFARQTFGIKLGLEPTRELLAAFDSPHHNLNVIHVAGTNGKGSTCAMLASVLSEAGFRTGLYASPHLVNFRERMRVNGEMISEERLALYARQMMPEIERIGCTFFEGTTAMAFRYFAEEQTDVVVLETGMGGRLDSTNVVTPMVSVITSIGLDHTKHLGETFEEIAQEKAGIIKPNVPVVVGRIRPRLRQVFSEVAQSVGSELQFVDDICRAVPKETGLQGTRADFMLGTREFLDAHIELAGEHQIENASVALVTLANLPEEYRVDDEALRNGFAHIRSNTGISGRFHHINSNPDIVLDVAHNSDGANALVRTLQHSYRGKGRIRVVYGAVKDKDVESILKIVAPLIRHVYAVASSNPRSLPSDEIAWHATNLDIPVTDVGSVEDGIKKAVQDVSVDEGIVIFGSFFVVGEALTAIRMMQAGANRAIQNENIADESIRRYTSSKSADYPVPPITTTPTHSTMNSSTKEDSGAMPAPANYSDGKQKKRPTTSSHRSVKDWNPTEQPRERLIKYGAQTLSNAELIAILLRTGKRGKDVLQVSRELLHALSNSQKDDAVDDEKNDKKNKALVDVAGRDLKELQRIDGIGPTKAVTLAAAFELSNRIVARTFEDRPVIRGPEDIARIFVPRMRALRKEQFHVVILNTAGRVIRTELVSEGTLNSSVVHPREVYRTAIIESAASIIGLHNHPSGNPEPSKEDIAITRQLVDAGHVLGIPFHDHMIIAGESYTSLVERGLM